MKLYTKTYTQRLTREVEGFEMPVELPDMPRERDMINYGLPIEKQKFRRTELPGDFFSWDKPRQDQYVADEWHKRYNGVWFLIKGNPVYITGPAYVFFSYWYTEAGPLPDFRMEAVDWFQVWEMVLRHPKCYGIFDIKGRRVGDTEKALFCGWELVTRYRKSWFGMQNTTEDDAQENFNRVVMSNRSMIFFFKPMVFGSDMPKRMLEFKYPARKEASKNEAQQQQYDLRYELDSKIDFRATEVKKYDGKRLRYYHLDEPGKISVSKMDIVKQWGIVKHCLSKNNGRYLIGRGMLTTTVEEFGDGSSVEKAKEMWDSSDPNNRNNYGETVSGLWRWFRGYKYGAVVDEYGYHKIEEATAERNEKIAQFIKAKQFDQLTSYKRQYPATIEESLVPNEADCSFNAFLLDDQKQWLDEKLAADEEWDTKPRRGNLEWKNGFGSDVKWVPSPTGRWEISMHPGMPNQRRRSSDGRWIPEGTMFAGGCDPVDHLKPQKDASMGAIAIGALYNPNLEKNAHLFEYDEFGNLLTAQLKMTDRPVCIYRYRPNNPYDLYNDVIKTVIYYGCKINVETNKPGVINYMNQKGFGLYVANQPLTTSHKSLNRRQRNVESAGTPATPETIASYIEALKVDVETQVGCYMHPDLISDMRLFTGEKKNRSSRDLTVAWGWAKVLMNSMTYLAEKTDKRVRWVAPPFRTYSYNNN